jgi:signal peptidase
MKKVRIAWLVGIILIVVIFGSITAYSGIWPPVSVVSSESMQHSSQWIPGVINTGDMVFIKKISDPVGKVQTYVTGSNDNYSNYGEFGNVIIYKAPNGELVIHRPLFYLYWQNGTPKVQGYDGQSWIIIHTRYILLKGIGYAHRNLVVFISQYQNISGYITAGDYNLGNAGSDLYFRTYDGHVINAYAAADQDQIAGNYLLGFYDPPVNSSQVIGIAYGLIPWIGSIKLEILWNLGLQKEENPVPSNALIYLGITVAVVFTLALFPYRKIIKPKKPSS